MKGKRQPGTGDRRISLFHPCWIMNIACFSELYVISVAIKQAATN